MKLVRPIKRVVIGILAMAISAGIIVGALVLASVFPLTAISGVLGSIFIFIAYQLGKLWEKQ